MSQHVTTYHDKACHNTTDYRNLFINIAPNHNIHHLRALYNVRWRTKTCQTLHIIAGHVMWHVKVKHVLLKDQKPYLHTLCCLTKHFSVHPGYGSAEIFSRRQLVISFWFLKMCLLRSERLPQFWPTGWEFQVFILTPNSHDLRWNCLVRDD